jgi:hypothetical protein
MAAALDRIERFADGKITKEETRSPYLMSFALWGLVTYLNAYEYAVFAGIEYFGRTTVRVAVLRELFGNPFRPVPINPAWQTPQVVDLAQAIYDDRSTNKMPILADALKDAGCNNADILAHCRGSGPHVKGCWVLDHLLGTA